MNFRLRDYGAGRAVLIDRHGRIIAGNKTFEQAKRPHTHRLTSRGTGVVWARLMPTRVV